MLITCSNCQSKIRVPDSAAGKRGKCPKCGTVIAIPASGEVEEAPAEAVPEPVADEPAGSPFDFSESAPPPSSSPRTSSRKAAFDEDEVVEEEPAEADDEAEAPRRKKVVKENTTLSLVSMILGIVSLLCSCTTSLSWCVAPLPVLCAVGAIVTGFLGMKQGGRGFAIAGLCCGGGGLLLTIVMIIVNIFVVAAMLAAGAAGGRH